MASETVPVMSPDGSQAIGLSIVCVLLLLKISRDA